jgi:hypothetical protein
MSKSKKFSYERNDVTITCKKKNLEKYSKSIKNAHFLAYRSKH